MTITVGEMAQMVTALAACAAVCVSLINMRKINVVHQLTNSLAAKAESQALAVGLAQGELAGRAAAADDTKAAGNGPKA